MEITIEKGVPAPQGRSSAKKYPFREMSAGDSFELALNDTDFPTINALQSSLNMSAASQIGRGKITTRTNADKTGVRCWRIA